MSSQNEEPENRVVAVVLIGAILLAVGLAVGMGIKKSRGGASAAAGTTAVAAVVDADAAAAAAPAAIAAEAAAPVAAAGDEASVVIENGVVKFYFASGKSDLASGAMAALGDAIAAAKGGKRLVLSGFHDASGDPVQNAELAKKRAISVRDALVGAGVAESAVELKKPEEAVGSGNAAEARRVEVMIAE
jgi:outer membrane protein OmpA-like peptidoglycan-associated protein